MSTKLGSLTLDLVAKIGNFVEPMNQAEKKAKGTSQTIADSFNVSTLAVNALGVAFAGVTVGGLAAFTNQIIDTGNEIKKLSQLSNTSTFDFQFYAKGAETAGISMESFADKMKDMQDRIGDFQQTGGGPLADFFTNIAPLVGVTIEQFQKLSGPEALQLFYNSLEKVGATQNDMKFYMESIISDSSLLIPLLENGGEGFKKWGQAASDAGAIMSDEMVDKLALAKENMQMLNLQIEGVQVSLINGLAPTIQTVANNLDVVAVAVGTVAVVMTAKAAPAFVMGTIEATRYQLALARMSAQAAGTTTTLTVLGGVARGALGLLGGPVGLALTVATTAGAYLLFRDNTDKSTVSLRENNETVEQAIQKYNELDKIKRAAQLVEEREKLEELSDSYEEANSKLISYTLNVVRSSDMTSEQASKFSSLVMDYKTGKITLEKLSDAVNKSTALSKDEKDAFIKKAASVRDASNEVNKHKNLVSQMIEKDKQLIKTNNDVADSIDRRGAALLKLTQKEREVYNSIGQELERENYINANVSRGLMSREQAEYFADKRSEAGIPYTKLLSKEMYVQIEQGYKLQQLTEKREETEKKLTEEKRKQQQIAEKTIKSQTIDSVIARGEGNYNSVNLGQKYGYKSGTRNLTSMSIAEVLAAQDRKEFNAAGKYQALPATLRGAIDSGIVSVSEKFNADVQERIVQNYLLTAKKGRNSVEDYIKGKSSDIVSANLDLSKEFASVANPATGKSYYAGVGNNKASIGAKEAQDALMVSRALYAQAIALGKSTEEAWKSAFNGSFTFVKDSDTQKALEVVLDAQNQAEELKKQSLERQSNVDKIYSSEERRMFIENEEAKKEIQEAYAENTEAIDKYLKLQELAYKKDVEAYRAAQYEKLNTPLSEMQSIGMNATAMATLSPMEYQKWELNNQQQAGYSQLGDSLSSAQAAINDNELLTETERYAQLEQVYEQYLQAKSALSMQYAKEEDDLRKQQQQQQIDLWGSVLSQGQNAFAQLTQSVKDANGEQSSSYKAMFAMQKAFTIASSMLAAYNAYATAFADPSAMTLPQKFAGGAAVMAALMPAITTISSLTLDGMAHDGIDSIPNEGTWLLDKGERVVDSRTNADLKSYLSNQKQQGPTININNNANADVSTRQNSDGSIDIDLIERQLADRLGRPSSRISKSIRQHTTARPRRSN